MSEKTDHLLGVEPSDGQHVASYCPVCGTQNTSGGRYCLNCGVDLSSTTTPAQSMPSTTLQAASTNSLDLQQVVITDFSMPFESMVVFMIKWALAAIPALIVLVVLLALISTIFGGALGGLLYGLFR